jgi:hypothetical protein
VSNPNIPELTPKSPAVAFASDPRWLLVRRIVASPGFASSPRLSTFLLHVSRECLHGRQAGLNERSIGEVVFERHAGYDPRDDNIVRSHATRLRQRLQEYFAELGAQEPMRVYIPRGSYIPVFEPVDLTAPAVGSLRGATELVDAETEADIGPLLAGSWSSRAKVALTSLGILTVVTATAAAFYLQYRSTILETPTHKLWSQMFRSNQQTLIVPADSNLVIARLMVGHPIALSEYADGSYRQRIHCTIPCDEAQVSTFESLRYTSMSDLEFAVKIAQRPEAIPDRTEIRFARDLELKDLKESNVILAGSEEADPWLSTISPGMNFVVHDHTGTDSLGVENKQPKAGEKTVYPYDPHNPDHRGMATISYLPNLNGTGNLLVVQGFSVAGTQAAAEFVTNGRDFDVLMRTYAGNRSKLPHFEILLSTVEMNGTAARAVPLAWHVYP